jgi:hypothetical protein
MVKLICAVGIGYLPAEHIETPTERLARLNKHRNVDVSFGLEGRWWQVNADSHSFRKRC